MRPTILPVALFCLALLGCKRSAVPGMMELALSDVDRDWNERGEDSQADTLRVLDGLSEAEQRSPAVMWRRARSLTAQGMLADAAGARRDAYADAREVALACLDGDGTFRERRVAVGIVRALPAVQNDRQPCVDQLAWAWSRWIVSVGAARASLDLEVVSALATASRGAQTTPWTRALVAVANDDLPAARSQLVTLMAARPGRLHLPADLVAFVLVPAMDKEAAASALEVMESEASVESPSHTAALHRAREAMQRLRP